MHVLAGGVVERDFHPAFLDDPVELQQEVGMEERAAKLAVGDRLQPQVFLVLRDLADRLVLDAAQDGGIDFAFGERGAGFDELLGAQETADVVAVATVLKDAAKEYAPPDETLLRYFGHGLSREQAAAIQKAKGAFVLEVQFPAGRMSQGLKAASVLIERAAIDGKGFIWDEETRELFTAEGQLVSVNHQLVAIIK